jgi:hypothetical protein
MKAGRGMEGCRPLVLVVRGLDELLGGLSIEPVSSIEVIPYLVTVAL